MDWWMFHSVGDDQCEACAVPPVPCEECGEGLVHIHFVGSLEALEGRCDACQKAEVPAPAAVD